MFFSRLVIRALKTTVLKWEMLLEFMSCVSVTFIQKTYENNSFCEITRCRQSLCHVCLQCIEGKHWENMKYYRNCVLKEDIRNKPSKASISNHIYCTLICDLQLLPTKLHCLFVSWVGHLNTIFNSTLGFLQCCEENMRNARGKGRWSCLNLTVP